MALSDIQAAIAKLKNNEFAELLRWCRNHHPHVWDLSIGGTYLKPKTNLQIAAETESYIEELVSGTKSKLRSGHDITSANGTVLEVKWSRLSNPKGGGSKTRDWTWAHLHGQRERKQYDRLILVAEPNPNCSAMYADPACQYVLFDIPFGELPSVMNVDKDNIQLNSNPCAIRLSSHRLRKIYADFQVTEQELRNRYR